MNDDFEISGRRYSDEQMEAIQELADWAGIPMHKVFMIIDGLSAIFDDDGDDDGDGRIYFFSACMRGKL